MKKSSIVIVIIIVAGFIILFSYLFSQQKSTLTNRTAYLNSNAQLDTATFGAGCFWCVEAIFQKLNGVVTVNPGYSGGHVANPSYEDVCSGATGHAEVCQILYDSKIISYDELLEVFWSVHDPTMMNQQGADIGTQYRSVIFYHDQKQKELAEVYKNKLNADHAFENNVVTEITPFTNFYKAENYHQNYYNENSSKPYCTMVIRPKVKKFEKIFKTKLRKD